MEILSQKISVNDLSAWKQNIIDAGWHIIKIVPVIYSGGSWFTCYYTRGRAN